MFQQRSSSKTIAKLSTLSCRAIVNCCNRKASTSNQHRIINNKLNIRNYTILHGRNEHKYRFLFIYHSIFIRLLRIDQHQLDRSRSIVSIAGAIARSALKLRYWIVGGTIGGGVAVANVGFTHL